MPPTRSWHANWSKKGSASSSSTTRDGISREPYATKWPDRPKTSIRHRPPWSPTSSSADSWRIHWSSGEGNSEEQTTVRDTYSTITTDGTTTPAHSPSGWPEAASNPVSSTGKPTSSDTTSSKTPSISTTSMQPYSTSSDSTTKN